MAVAIGCVGAKRGLFDGEDNFSPPSSKRVRLLCSPRNRFSPGLGVHSAQLTQLRILFPDMELQVLTEALESSGNNIDSAIKRLEELRLGTAPGNENVPPESAQDVASEATTSTHSLPETATGADQLTGEAEPTTAVPNESQNLAWADAIVQEMSSAVNIDDARARAVNILQKFEGAVATKVAHNADQVTTELRNHLQNLARDNSILKRAVTIQNSRQQEYANKDQELDQLRQTVAQYREQLRAAEMNNYALAVHLRQAMGGVYVDNGGHPPDVC